MRQLGGLLDIFLQSKCPLCQRATTDIFCLDCDRTLNACRFDHFQQTLADIPIFSWGVYDGLLKRAIATCKYEKQPKIAKALGEKMAKDWTDKFPDRLTIVPIPLHSERLRTRGFNQAEVLARSFCDRLNLSCSPQLLQRIKNTKPQIETKNKQEREANLNQAFVARSPPPKFDTVWLLDDIYTSGATVKEAIAAFKKIGIKISGVIVLAKPKSDLEQAKNRT
jgi:ComF family protein